MSSRSDSSCRHNPSGVDGAATRYELTPAGRGSSCISCRVLADDVARFAHPEHRRYLLNARFLETWNALTKIARHPFDLAIALEYGVGELHGQKYVDAHHPQGVDLHPAIGGHEGDVVALQSDASVGLKLSQRLVETR